MKALQGNLPHEYSKTDIHSIAEPWIKHFKSEVDSGNFLRGGKSLMLHGLQADHVARQWIACLQLAGFKVYRTTPLEAVRRCQTLAIIGDDEDRALSFIEAECVLIDDFFDGASWSADSQEMFTWYFRELHRNGVVIILASTLAEPELDKHGSTIGDLIEKNFEVISYGASDKKKKIKPNKPVWSGSR